jgi:hypothetical protein
VRNATRNSIILWVTIGVCVVLTGLLGWIVVQISDGIAAPAVYAVGFLFLWIHLISGTIRDSREFDRIGRGLRDAGVPIPGEKRLPIRLAENRESLIASIMARTLIALVFIACLGGWFPSKPKG